MSSVTNNTAVFEALFRQAVIDNFYDELNSLPTEKDLADQFVFSPSHELRMQRLFARDARRDRIQTAIKWSKRIAAIIVITLALFFGTLMLVPQVRAVVFQTILEWYDKYVTFTSNVTDAEKSYSEPGYLPENYREVFRDSKDMGTLIVYMNDADQTVITFQSFRVTATTAVDNEMMEYSVAIVNDVEFHIFNMTDDSSENTVVWERNEQRYIITSTISTDELMKIAVTIKN